MSEFEGGDKVRIKTTGKTTGTVVFRDDEWVKVSTPAGTCIVHSSHLRRLGRPKEPTLYGAVVVDKHGTAWSFAGYGEWYAEGGETSVWAGIKKPTVLFEGVPE